MKSILLGLALCLPLSCKPTSGSSTAEGTSSSSPHRAVSSATTPTSTPATSPSTPSSTPPSTPVNIQFRVSEKAARYVGYVRFWREALSLERLDGSTWVRIPFDPPLCADPCPMDGSTPSCRDCSPPAPQPSYRTVSGLGGYLWSATTYETRPGKEAHCFCYQQKQAPSGRYRFTLCTHPEVQCDMEPCDVTGQEEGSGEVTGSERCDSVEFDYAGEKLTLVLPVEGSR